MNINASGLGRMGHQYLLLDHPSTMALQYISMLSSHSTFTPPTRSPVELDASPSLISTVAGGTSTVVFPSISPVSPPPVRAFVAAVFRCNRLQTCVHEAGLTGGERRWASPPRSQM